MPFHGYGFPFTTEKVFAKVIGKDVISKMRKSFYLKLKGLFNPLSEIKGSIIELGCMYLKAKCIPKRNSTLENLYKGSENKKAI